MKRKIAVFANAWSEKCLSDALDGVKICATKNDFDVFVFVSHAAPGMSEDEQREEKRIYQLPVIEEYDGVIVFSSTMNFMDLVYDIRDRAVAANVPAVSVGIQVDGMAYVGMNTAESMYELVEHLVKDHHIRDVEFIAGPKDNENSDLRVQATKKVFVEYDIPFCDERIHYGDWSVRGAMQIAESILEKRKENLPDAIICANDNLAMAACTEIERIGLKVPDDIVVTGFDNIHDGQIFYPALCTVGQNDFIVGSCACEALMQLIYDGKTQDLVIRNQFIRNQSCGCENASVDHLRLEECKNRFYDKIKTLEFGWSNNWVSQAVLSGKNIEQSKKQVEEYFQRSKIFGNGTTYILEDANAKLYFAGKENLVHSKGYSDELEVFVAVERHVPVLGETIQRRELIPGYQKKDNESRMYIIMPIHFVDWVFGYAVVEDWLEGISTGKIKIFVDIFNQTIDKLKQNLALEYLNEKLTDLYTRDSLTGMYNRFGFDSEGVKVFDYCKKNKEHMMLMFTDINRMKLINDYYGHLQGDLAIKTAAEVICKNIKKDWIPIRFGGDEFLIIGKCDKEEEIIAIQKKITAEVRETGKRMQYPFYLSVSCGYLYFTPEDERTLDSYIKQADVSMYEIKAYMHASDEELREFVEKCTQNSGS